MNIGFVTASDLSRYFPSKQHPLITHDDIVAYMEIQKQGHQVSPVIWGTNPDQLTRFDVLVVRSPWDYMDSDEKRSGIFAWLQRVADAGIRLENSLPWLLWNSDKHYLLDLAEHGAPIVPTKFIESEDQVGNPWLEQYFADNGPFVLKPAISAAAKDTFLINSLDVPHALSSLNGQVTGDFGLWRGQRSFLVQPFLSEIKTAGEWSLVYFDGDFSHAVHKLPATGEWLVQDELGGSVLSAVPPAVVLAAGKKTVNAVLQVEKIRSASAALVPLYMRIDVIVTGGGALVGEVEMIEPELFFLKRERQGTSPDLVVAKKFVDALVLRQG